MSFSSTQKLAVLCDFDGTITPGDILDILYTKFAGPECQELAKKWFKGEISTPLRYEAASHDAPPG
jgi:2-hydroxy-3-keto-5-methylthiopentenyl-1-phosphate phosphatase